MRRRPALILLAVVTAPLLLSAVVSLTQSGQQLFPWGDHAGLAVETHDAAHVRQFVGTYSRFGWYHPNPSFFYLMAPLFTVLGRNPVGMSVMMALINGVAAALIVWIAWRRGGRIAALLAGIGTAILLARIGAVQLRDYWVPFSVTVPFAALAFSCAAVAVGDLVFLPLVLALATFVAGNDLSCAPVVAGLAAGAVVFGLIFRYAGRDRLPPLGRRRIVWIIAGSLIVLAVLWALPVYDEIHNKPGNISAIRAFFKATKGEHTAGEGMASLAFVVKNYFWLPGKWFEPPAATVGSMLATLAVFALLVLGVVVGLFRRRWFGTALAALSMVAMTTEMAAVPNIRGPLYNWLVAWLAGIGPAIITGIGLTLGPELSALRTRVRLPGRIGIVPALLAVLGVLTVVNLVHLGQHLQLKNDSIYAHTYFLKPLNAKLENWFHVQNVSRPLFSIGTGIEWFDGAALASRRDREGAAFSMEGPPTGAFGKRHFPNGTEDADVWIRGPAEPLPKGMQLIWRANGISVFVHRRPRASA